MAASCRKRRRVIMRQSVVQTLARAAPQAHAQQGRNDSQALMHRSEPPATAPSPPPFCVAQSPPEAEMSRTARCRTNSRSLRCEQRNAAPVRFSV